MDEGAGGPTGSFSFWLAFAFTPGTLRNMPALQDNSSQRSAGKLSCAVNWRLALVALQLLFGSRLMTLAETNATAIPPFKISAAREYLRDLAQWVAARADTNADSLYTRARLLKDLGEREPAEALARQALQLQTNRADIAIFVADLLIRADRMEEAEAALNQAVSANPNVPGGQRQLGMVLDRLGKPAEAEAAFTSATRSNPADATAWLLLGRFLLDHGRVAEAITNLERSCSLDTNLVNAYYPLFRAYTKQGKQEAAQAALQRFRQLEKADKAGMGTLEDAKFDNEGELRSYTAGMHTEIGNLLRRQGKAELAEAHYLRATEIDARRPEAFEALATLYSEQNQPERALAMLKKVVELKPNQIWTRVNYGTLLLQNRHVPEAVDQLQHVLELDPRQPQALYNLARYYLGSKSELPKALDMSQRLVAADPSGNSYDLLGWAYYANGRTNEALKAMAQAVEKAPDNPGIQQRYERLKKVAGSK